MNGNCVPVTGTNSIVGFTHGQDDHHRGGDYHFHSGISDKDQGFQASVDAGERTRDVLHGQRLSDKLNWDGHTASQIAVEKIGAANILAVEKTTSELRVQAERIRADQAAETARNHLAQTMALSDMRLEQQKQACEIEAKLAACCCDLKAEMKQIEANRVRDDLAAVRAELIALRSGPGNGN